METSGQTVGSLAEIWIQRGNEEDGSSFGKSTEIESTDLDRL